ncbi:MAG: RnfABCDGE type electron transport complex subunit B [Oscillospiraceae bacterium]|nr:RnfABCDGE type electron transport complex subunit B [Oscillospiraceae bacterium]
MEIIITAIIVTGVIGLISAAMITIATKLMFVKVDPRVEKLMSILPGANCGACGFSGCEGYANALAKGEVAANLCPPGGNDTYEKINELLGLDAGEGLVSKTAIIHCMGDTDTMKSKMIYNGISTCFAAKQLYGGQGSCSFGCLGFGDCVKICPSHAICITKDIAHVDIRRCSGCEVCLKVCPTGVISVEKMPVHVAILCRNTEKGAIVKDKCGRGCISCMKCVRECHAGAIAVNESLAVIDYTKCDGCGHCAEICIKKCIVAY